MRYGDRTLAGLVLLIASSQFLLVMLIAEGTLPDYSVSTDVISALGVGPTAPLFNASVILLGLLTLAGAYFYHRTHRVRWITVPYVIAAIGPVGVGLFPETVPGLHGLFALIAFLVGSIVPILVSTRLPPPLRYVSIFLGLVGLAALILFTTGNDLGIGVGGMERMIAYPVLLWGIAFGGYLMAVPDMGPAAAAPKPDE